MKNLRVLVPVVAVIVSALILLPTPDQNDDAAAHVATAIIVPVLFLLVAAAVTWIFLRRKGWSFFQAVTSKRVAVVTVVLCLFSAIGQS